jgi:hypothetical protein
MSAKPKIAPARQRQKHTRIAPPVKSRRYHVVDDDAAVFDYELPDWLVGAN